MPSPIAHTAMAILLYPAAQRQRLIQGDRTRRLTLMFLLFTALCLPDLDFAVGWVYPGTPLGTHAIGMHSLVVGTIGAAVLALLGAVFAKGSVVKLYGLFVGAIALHLLMDMMTWGGQGIALLWPFSEMRIRLPFSLFYGVRHSNPGAWHLHLITLVSELMFAGLVWLVARWRQRGLSQQQPEAGVA